MNDDTKERIEILTKALGLCVGEGAQLLVTRILFLEENDINILDGFKELQDKLREVEQQRETLNNAIWFLISELKDNEQCNSGCSKILKNWDDYRKKYGL